MAKGEADEQKVYTVCSQETREMRDEIDAPSSWFRFPAGRAIRMDMRYKSLIGSRPSFRCVNEAPSLHSFSDRS